MTVNPPVNDDLFNEQVPEASQHRDYSDLVIGLMEVWDTSKPKTQKRMEKYNLNQCEWLLRERWINERR